MTALGGKKMCGTCGVPCIGKKSCVALTMSTVNGTGLYFLCPDCYSDFRATFKKWLESRKITNRLEPSKPEEAKKDTVPY